MSENVRKSRHALFDEMPANQDFEHEIDVGIFVLNSSDRVISRHIYICNEAFEFDKFIKALDLVGRHRDLGEIATLIDVGANLGSICIPAARLGVFKRIVAFEPDPGNFGRLESAIALNRLNDIIEAHPTALGEETGETVALELSESNFGDHRICLSDEAGHFCEPARRKVDVRQEKLDDYLELADGAGSLIWMDTQGYEGYILAGASRFLSERPPMVLEFWPYGMKRSGSYEKFCTALLEAPHEVFLDLDAPSPGLVPLTRSALDSLFEKFSSGIRFTDILVL